MHKVKTQRFWRVVCQEHAIFNIYILIIKNYKVKKFPEIC